MRKKTVKHTTLPDPKFGDVQVTKFVNNLMYDGKKSKSFDIFYRHRHRCREERRGRSGGVPQSTYQRDPPSGGA
jgi:small subunit ribosomal protein S7